MKLIHTLSMMLLTIMLISCSSLLTSNEKIRYFYVLNPVGEIMDIQYPAHVRLWVPEISIPEWLNTQKIILRHSNNRVDFYSEARWATEAGKMVRDIVVRSLENNRVATDVAMNRTNIEPDYRLDIEVFALQANYSKLAEPPTAVVALQGKLISLPSGKIHYQFTVENRTKAKEDTLNAIVKALDTSMQESLEEVVERTAKGLAVR